MDGGRGKGEDRALRGLDTIVTFWGALLGALAGFDERWASSLLEDNSSSTSVRSILLLDSAGKSALPARVEETDGSKILD